MYKIIVKIKNLSTVKNMHFLHPICGSIRSKILITKKTKILLFWISLIILITIIYHILKGWKSIPFSFNSTYRNAVLISWYALGNQRKWYSRWSRWCVTSSISLVTKGFVEWNSNGVYLYLPTYNYFHSIMTVFCSTSQLGI